MFGSLARTPAYGWLVCCCLVASPPLAARATPSQAPLAAAPTDAPPEPAAAAAAGPGSARQNAPAVNEQVTSYRLSNGLEVVLLRDARLARVAVSVGYRVGARNDPPGYRGLAHLVEHMMFEGLRDAEHSDFFDYLADGGSTDANATTDLDRTIYFEEVPRERLDVALWLESRRMGYLLDHIQEADLERARAAVLNEWEMRVGDGGLRSMLAIAAEALYPQSHPYRQINDEPDDLEAITLSDVQWFFQQHYGPANARLVLVGDFDETVVRTQIEKLFGPLRQRGAVAPVSAIMDAARGDQRILGVWPFTNNLCATVWPLLPMDEAEGAALEVLHHHLVSLLRDRLVSQSGMTKALFSDHDERELGGEIALFASFDPDTHPTKVTAAIDAAVSRVQKHGISRAALKRAKHDLMRDAILAGEGLIGRAYRLASPRALPTVDPYVARAQHVAAVTSQAVQSAAAKHLSMAQRAWVCMTQDDDAPRMGKVVEKRFVQGAKQ